MDDGMSTDDLDESDQAASFDSDLDYYNPEYLEILFCGDVPWPEY